MSEQMEVHGVSLTRFARGPVGAASVGGPPFGSTAVSAGASVVSVVGATVGSVGGVVGATDGIVGGIVGANG